MKKELTLRYNAFQGKRVQNKTALFPISFNLNRYLTRSVPIMWLSRFYSKIMEERISPEYTLRLLHAQFAAFVLLSSVCTHFLLSFVLFIWTLWAVLNCRRKEN